MLPDAPDAGDLWSSQADTAAPTATNLPAPFPWRRGSPTHPEVREAWPDLPSSGLQCIGMCLELILLYLWVISF